MCVKSRFLPSRESLAVLSAARDARGPRSRLLRYPWWVWRAMNPDIKVEMWHKKGVLDDHLLPNDGLRAAEAVCLFVSHSCLTCVSHSCVPLMSHLFVSLNLLLSASACCQPSVVMIDSSPLCSRPDLILGAANGSRPAGTHAPRTGCSDT